MTGILLSMQPGPYQDNGASPWFAPLVLGTGSPPQVQNFALDTGTNMVWATSSLCSTAACLMHNRFDPAQSSSFAWIDQSPHTLSYGPWGDLTAEIASDVLNLPDGTAIPTVLGMATDYSGPKFQEVDWDACLAFPAQGPTQLGFSFFMEDLLNLGLVDPAQSYVSFDWDGGSGTGSCRVGGFDPSKVSGGGIFLPWSEYDVVPGVGYIWTAQPATVSVAGKQLADNTIFGFDSGSSLFKGDCGLIATILANLVPAQGDVEIDVGLGTDGSPGRMVVPSSVYMRTIEKGPNAGDTLPQFAPLDGVPQLLIVGSVLMEYLYTIYQYRPVRDPSTGKWVAKPHGTWVFNRPGGPQIIQNGVMQGGPALEAPC